MGSVLDPAILPRGRRRWAIKALKNETLFHADCLPSLPPSPGSLPAPAFAVTGGKWTQVKRRFRGGKCNSVSWLEIKLMMKIFCQSQFHNHKSVVLTWDSWDPRLVKGGATGHERGLRIAKVGWILGPRCGNAGQRYSREADRRGLQLLEQSGRLPNTASCCSASSFPSYLSCNVRTITRDRRALTHDSHDVGR